MEKLCIHYGPLLVRIDDISYYDFPAPSALTGPGIETHLRELGFGYRAKYIWRTANIIANERPTGWLDKLRNPESPAFGLDTKISSAGKMAKNGREGYREAHESLLELQGVGPKVADCVSLMGLGWGEAVPVDTHVWQIAQRDYKFGRGKHSSLTKATYDAVGDHFRDLWGVEAGWAHSVLFTADLKAFSERVVAKRETVKKEEVKIKGKDGEEVDVKKVIKKEVVRKVKREFEEEEKPILEVAELVTTKKRKTRNSTGG
jgi:N-glycosylase/DNA lyase